MRPRLRVGAAFAFLPLLLGLGALGPGIDPPLARTGQAAEHDAVVDPAPPKSFKIPARRAALDKKLRVKVRNADAVGSAAFEIRLEASDGTCPPGTIAGSPDFGRLAAGNASTVDLAAGHAAAALVPIRLTRAAFDTHNELTPTRCTIEVIARPAATGEVDPSPDNAVARIALDVVDLGDPPGAAVHESVLAAVRPIRMSLSARATQATKLVAVKVANADVLPDAETPGHEITLIADDGDCPPGTVSSPDFDRRTAGTQGTALVAGKKHATARLTVTVDGSAFFTPNVRAARRCTALVHATGPAGNVEPDASNDTARLVIDVVDQADAGAPTPTPAPSATPTPTPGATPSATPVATATPTPTGSVLPPEPADVAPVLDQTIATNLADATGFLHSGTSPIQSGVADGAIDAARAALLRGRVLDASGAPLPGATVSILGHAELGATTSRASGGYDIVVNGGGPVTVSIRKAGFLPLQRTLDVPWQEYVVVADVVLIAADPAVTTVDLGPIAASQIARGSVQSDARGTRRATLLFPQGTEGELVMPDGSSSPIGKLSVRATEYTVGDAGPLAMPAELPPTSGYTYAVELDADEVDAAGAATVRFSQPVLFYVENFIGMPGGIPVPMAYYDRAHAAWVPTQDGRVVAVLGVTSGVADVDTDGDALADDGSTLVPPMTSAERAQLGSLYAAGQSLWRVPVGHFTAYDPNYGVVAGTASSAPVMSTPRTASYPQLCEAVNQDGLGSVAVQNQTFVERVRLVGTPTSLAYSSARMPGYAASDAIRIRMTGSTLPPGIKSVRLGIDVAGRHFEQSFTPAPDLSYDFAWDGHDAYGRVVRGEQTATVRLEYFYPGYYALPPSLAESFGFPSGVRVPGDIPSRQDASLEQVFRVALGRSPEREVGGWSVTGHHVYDPVGRVLYQGDGRRRSAQDLNVSVLTIVAGTGDAGATGDGGPATAARLYGPQDVAVGPDGSVYVADTANHRVRRIARDGTMTTVAGTGTAGNAGEGVPATAGQLSWPSSVAVGPDGSLYIASLSESSRIRRVSPDGLLTTFAGTGTAGFSGDDGPAVQAQISEVVHGLAVASDGTVYFTDENRVRVIAPNGRIATLAGTGAAGFSGDDGPASAAKLASPHDVALGPDGSVYVVDSGNAIVRRIGRDGVITTVAGAAPPVTAAAGGLLDRLAAGARELLRTAVADASGVVSEDGVPAVGATIVDPTGVAVSRTGTLYISERSRIRLVDSRGIIRTLAGGGTALDTGIPAAQAYVDYVAGLAVGPDGSVYFADPDRNFYVAPALAAHFVGRIGSSLPGFTAEQIAIAGDGGRALHEFDASGRHLRTRHALTGAVLREFGYDMAGRLTTIADGDGNVTTIERDASGVPTAITSPFGQRSVLTIDANGYLASVRTPEGRTTTLTHDADGLLTSITGPLGYAYAITYDAAGRVAQVVDPAGGSSTLTSVETADGRDVFQTSALGRSASFSVEDLPTGDRARRGTAWDGTVSKATISPSGLTTNDAPDGSLGRQLLGPDPMFGMEQPFAVETRVATPGGLQRSITRSRSAVAGVPGDPATLVTRTEIHAINGRTWTNSWDAATRTFTTTSPLGRQATRTIDVRGRTTGLALAGMEPLQVAYDTRGRIATVIEGSGPGARTHTFSYGPDGLLASTEDPLGRTVHFAHDGDGLLRSVSRADSTVVGYDLDGEGNVVAVTAPGGGQHALTYDPAGRPLTYTPPFGAAPSGTSTRTYDLDHQLAVLGRADGASIVHAYDATTGRPLSATSADRVVSFGYDASGRTTSVTTSDGVALGYAYDGFLLTGETFAGPVAGSVARGYDDDLRLTSLRVAGAPSIDFTYDDDGLVVGAGDLTLSRSAATGLVASTSVGRIDTIRTYDGFGAVIAETGLDDSSPLIAQSVTRDALGRIATRSETISGATHGFAYEYDLVGRLSRVERDGSVLATYGYDANGNRVSDTGALAMHDVEDRLLTAGSVSYAYDANGQRIARSDGSAVTSYAYDSSGNLVGVTLPGGSVVSYVVDGWNRRLARKVDGVVTAAWLYRDAVRPVAELDEGGNVVAQFVYVGSAGTPALVLRDGGAYRVLTDFIGSPRLVVDVATGAVAQRIDYDAFGRVTLDTNPGFQPFGFAGGLHDPATGLVHFGRRDYDAAAGRWLTKDPLNLGGGDTNLYAYVGNDPVNSSDPLGSGPTLNTVGTLAAAGITIGAGNSGGFNPNQGGNGGAFAMFNKQLQKQLQMQQQAEIKVEANENLTAWSGDKLRDMAKVSTDALGTSRPTTVKGAQFEVESLGFKPTLEPENLTKTVGSTTKVAEESGPMDGDGSEMTGELYQTFQGGAPIGMPAEEDDGDPTN